MATSSFASKSIRRELMNTLFLVIVYLALIRLFPASTLVPKFNTKQLENPKISNSKVPSI